ncbi:aldehyde dehydrogenase [Spectribacter hydrogenoxidans]|uniref:aldehyde dehydrogenase (NAD(+)) n=1 Tax=Spectribacter hydrogenoxidans TaxID=3075608 RepID=A0ABU3C4D0_9GAMM|nr:aldehyde dehydrogenase [Salinisphaera sp. W335]MDT0636390.1 aldehyde dehydrogenase [Salinisphaera sp. W335]
MAQASEQVTAGAQSARDFFYIGGEWAKPATDKRFNLVNAATEEGLGSVPEGVEADMDRAVAAARHAFDHSGWAQTSGPERAAIMNRFADELEKRAPQIAPTVSSQNGMPISLASQFEAGFPILMLRYYAGLAEGLQDEEERTSPIGQQAIVRRTPIGVVAGIVPWNFPATLAMSKIGPAMAAGCTLVLKPSPGTALDWYFVAEAAEEAGVPPGVINWVPGDRAAGAHLVAHPGVDKVAFTGSTAAGRKVAQVCGEALRPVTLELGGKSAGIVLDDADLDATIPGLQFASLLNNGQACLASTRILAPRSRYDEVVDALADMARGLSVGDPMDESTQVGPMASAEHRDRVLGYVEKGKQEARCVAGGGRPGKLDKGWFVEPTIFANLDNNATIAREEIFGPVLVVIPYDDDEDAIRIANDSEYGLGGSVWSADHDRALNMARRVETGSIGVNGYNISIGSPFGGIKSSGIGREFSQETLAGFQQMKSIYL